MASLSAVCPHGPDRVGEGALSGWDPGHHTLSGVPLSSLCTLHGPWRNTSCLSGRRRPATKSPSFILCFIHSCLEARISLRHLLCAPLGTQQHRAIALILVLWKAHSLPENLVLRWGLWYPEVLLTQPGGLGVLPRSGLSSGNRKVWQAGWGPAQASLTQDKRLGTYRGLSLSGLVADSMVQGAWV